MPPRKTENSKESQSDRFIETARALECDEDKERFEEKLKRIAKAKPKPPSNPPENE
jgi:pyruvate-formate lyase